MEKIIRMILAMPAITLTDQEWIIAQKIVCQLANLSSNNPRDEIDHYPLPAEFDAKRFDYFKYYLKRWIDLTDELIHWKNGIAAVWESLFLHRPGGEDYLAIYIFLIPDHGEPVQTLKERLKTLVVRLDTACELDFTMQRGCTLDAFRSGIASKLDILTHPDNPDGIDKKLRDKIDKLREHLPNAAIEIERLEQIEQLTRHCGNYKQHLADLIKTKLTKEYQDLYNTCFNASQPNEDMAILDIICINLKSESTLIKNKELLLLLERFSIFYDLHHTCVRKDVNAEHKLQEFGAKYLSFQDILEKDNDELGIKVVKVITGYALLKKIYTLLPPSVRSLSTEEHFSRSASMFSVRRNTHDGIVPRIAEKMNPMSLVVSKK